MILFVFVKIKTEVWGEMGNVMRENECNGEKLLPENQWIDATKEKPKCSEKFSESEDVLCWTRTNTYFVGWYNSRLDRWFVSHFLAESVALTYDNVPEFWMELPKKPVKR